MRAALALLILSGVSSWATAAAAQGNRAAAPTLTSGTAFFVSPDGTALTAAHVIEGCTRLRVAAPSLPGAEGAIEAVPVAADPGSDLALLRAAVTRVPGVIGIGPVARVRGGAGLRVLGYGPAPRAPLQEAAPGLLNARLRVRSADPRFRIWLQDDRIAHGWSGGPILVNGRLAGVLLELLPDPAETARVFGRPERGVAAGTDDAAVAALLARAGIRPGASSGPPRNAMLRVFCWR